MRGSACNGRGVYCFNQNTATIKRRSCHIMERSDQVVRYRQKENDRNEIQRMRLLDERKNGCKKKVYRAQIKSRFFKENKLTRTRSEGKLFGPLSPSRPRLAMQFSDNSVMIMGVTIGNRTIQSLLLLCCCCASFLYHYFHPLFALIYLNFQQSTRRLQFTNKRMAGESSSF